MKLCFLILMTSMFSGHLMARTLVFPFMGRMFNLTIPNSAGQTSRPLLVLLHGCKQNPKIILDGSQIKEKALKNNFFVLTPEQSTVFNSDHCWNWFLSSQQDRSIVVNEMAQIMATVEMLMDSYKIDRSKTFVAGMSAGGAMAHNLAACYPDYFQGAAIHSGLAFKVAESLEEANTVLTVSDQKSPEYLGKQAYKCGRGYKNPRISKFMIIHGSEDKRVLPIHAELISRTNEVWWDYMDDGRRNSSTRVQSIKTFVTSNSDYTITKTERSYPFNNMLEQKLIINGMAHAWGGGKAVSNNFDPKAPPSSDLILDFFQLQQ